MASEHALLARLEEHFDSALAHHDFYRSRLEAIMKFLPELAEKVRSLSASHQSEIARANAAEARADAAEKERDDLKAQIAADEDTAKGALDVVDAELTAETAPAAASSSTDPVTTTTPSGATVTVDPAAGVTTHVDPVASITTTVDHETGAATAVDNSTSPATPVEPAPAVVAEATAAAVAAGVDVPASS